MRPALLALPILLLLPVAAHAQARGSYRGSCTNINQDGSMLSARCQGPDGQLVDSTIDVDRCGNVGVANSNGRLTCGNVRGSARFVGGGGYGGEPRPRPRRYDDGGDSGPAGYGYAPRRPRYAPDPQYDPPPRRRFVPDPDE